MGFAPFTFWYFRDVYIQLEGQMRVFSITTKTRRFATTRGLRVGDDTIRVLQLYGEPLYRSEEGGEWMYANRHDPEQLFVNFKRESVTAITVRHMCC